VEKTNPRVLEATLAVYLSRPISIATVKLVA